MDEVKLSSSKIVWLRKFVIHLVVRVEVFGALEGTCKANRVDINKRSQHFGTVDIESD